MNNEEKPLITYVKRADKTVHKIQLPQKALDMFGEEYFFMIYKDRIELIPTNSIINKNAKKDVEE